ncbi:hypothetical protein LTR95_009918 [Oleoguttula sp. CCFEE 5521]
MPEGTKPLLQSQGSQTRFNMSKQMENQKRKKVLVVGAGAAGMTCAHHLAQHPDKFDVTVVDAVNYCGGQAYSIPIDKEKTGASWLNQGVQGGSYIFHHTMTNAPEVPSMVLERLCTSPTYGMWYPPDKNSVASNLPPMVVFPNFSEFYETWRQNLIKMGVKVRLSTEVTRVTRRDKNGVQVKIIGRTPAKDGHNQDSAWVPNNVEGSQQDGDKVETTEEYDEIVLCVLTDTAARLLKPTITTIESKVLGSAKFANDITVTHTDIEYMKKHYENFYNKEQAVTELNGVNMQDRVDFAKEKFKPMYMIKMYPQDLTKLEMCFDCTNYQSQFPPEVPFENHVFQTIFLNKERDGHLWSIDEIDESKIIRKDWWHQLCHSFTHYLFVVPWMWLLNGKRHTRYAASWTMVNAHEVACISGISAAVDLGADYPEDLERDSFALLSFRLYYLLTYGRWYKRKATKTTKEGEGKSWATGVYGSTYNGPGVNAEEERRLWKREVEKGRSLEGF